MTAEQPLSAETGMHPTPASLPEDVKDGPERDAAFAPTNDSIWGAGNWLKCYVCPPDRKGNPVYHHVEAHAVCDPECRDPQAVCSCEAAQSDGTPGGGE